MFLCPNNTKIYQVTAGEFQTFIKIHSKIVLVRIHRSLDLTRHIMWLPNMNKREIRDKKWH